MFKALIIEDDPQVAELVCLTLERSGLFECISVPQLRAAWSLIEENGIDVIFLDKRLRDSEGFEGLKEVLRRVPHMPVVVGTGDTDEAKQMHALRLGAQDYVFKPFDTRTLPETLLKAIARHRYRKKLLENMDNLKPRQRSKIEWGVIVGGAATILAAIIKAISDWLQ